MTSRLRQHHSRPIQGLRRKRPTAPSGGKPGPGLKIGGLCLAIGAGLAWTFPRSFGRILVEIGVLKAPRESTGQENLEESLDRLGDTIRLLYDWQRIVSVMPWLVLLGVGLFIWGHRREVQWRDSARRERWKNR